MGTTLWTNYDGRIWWTTAFATQTLTGATHAVGGVFRARAATAITHVVVPCTAISSPGAFTVQLESVSAGLPTGTPLGSTATSWTPVVGTTEVALASSYTPSAGDVFAATVTYGSGTNATFVRNAAGLASPYAVRNPGTGWVGVTSAPPGVGIKYSDGTYSIGCCMCHLIGSVAITNASATREAGLAMTSPAQISVAGADVYFDGIDKAFSLLLYLDESTTPTATATVAASSFGATGTNYLSLLFPSAVSVNANQKFRLVLRSDSSSTITVYRRRFSTTALRDAVVGAAYYTSRATGSWTDVAEDTPHITPLIVGVVGGGIIRTGMSGGFF